MCTARFCTSVRSFFTASCTSIHEAGAPSRCWQCGRACSHDATSTGNAREKVTDLTVDLAAATTPQEKTAAAAKLAGAERELQATRAALNAITSATQAVANDPAGKGAGSLSSATDKTLSATKMDARHPAASRIIRHAVFR
jgi:hypothetical protein